MGLCLSASLLFTRFTLCYKFRATPSILLQVVPRTIAENAGLNATSVMSFLHAAHASGRQKAGLDIETGEPKDLTEQNLYDL